MKTSPFRFLSPTERRHILDKAAKIKNVFLQHFDFCHIQLKPAASSPEIRDPVLMASERMPFMLIDACELNALSSKIFHTEKPHTVFQETIQHFFLQGFAEVFKDPSLCFQEKLFDKNWFYPGSPCQQLTLRTNYGVLSGFLNPEWILSQLPSLTPTKRRLHSVSECLEEESLALEVCLESFSLTLRQLSELKPGRVLVLEHSIRDPVYLNISDKTLARGHLGQKNSYKAIQLGVQKNEID